MMPFNWKREPSWKDPIVVAIPNSVPETTPDEGIGGIYRSDFPN